MFATRLGRANVSRRLVVQESDRIRPDRVDLRHRMQAHDELRADLVANIHLVQDHTQNRGRAFRDHGQSVRSAPLHAAPAGGARIAPRIRAGLGIYSRISHFPSWRNGLASVHWAKPTGYGAGDPKEATNRTPRAIPGSLPVAAPNPSPAHERGSP